MSKLSLILLRMSQSDVKKEKKKKSKQKLEEGESSPLQSSSIVELLEGNSNQIENRPPELKTEEISVSQQSSHESGQAVSFTTIEKDQQSSNEEKLENSEMITKSRSASKEYAQGTSFETSPTSRNASKESFQMVSKSRNASKDSVTGTLIENNRKARQESGQNLTKAKNKNSETKIVEISSEEKTQAKNKAGESSSKIKSSGSNLVKQTESSNDAHKETGILGKKSSRILNKTKSTSKINVRETEDKKETLVNSDEGASINEIINNTGSKENNKTNTIEQKALTNTMELASIEEEQPKKSKESDENLTERIDADTRAEPSTNQSELPKTEDPLSSGSTNDNPQPVSEEKLCFNQDQSALEALHTIKEIILKLETTFSVNNARRSTCLSVEVQTQDDLEITERSELVAMAGSVGDPQQDPTAKDQKRSFTCDLEKTTKGFHFVNASEQTGACNKHCKMKLMLSENAGESFCKDLHEAGSQAPDLNRCPCTLQRSHTNGPSKVYNLNHYGSTYNEDDFTDRGSVGHGYVSDRRVSSDEQYANSCQKCIASMVDETLSQSEFDADCCQKCCLACMGCENSNDPDCAERCQGCSAAISGSDNITDDQFEDLCQKYLNQVSENIHDLTFIERCKKCNIQSSDGEDFRGNTLNETRPRSSVQSNGSKDFRSSDFIEQCQRCGIPSTNSEKNFGNNFTVPPCKNPTDISKVSPNSRGTHFTETCKKCSIAGSGASPNGETCKRCGLAKYVAEPHRDSKYTDRNRINTDPNNETKYVENDFFIAGYPDSNGGFSSSGKGSLRDTRSNSISKSRNVRFNEAVDEKHVSNIHLSQANEMPYSSLDHSSVSSLAGNANYFSGEATNRRSFMEMPAHHRRGTPYPGSSQTRLSPIEDETFLPLEFTSSGSYYYEQEVPNANYGYEGKRGGRNAPETPLPHLRQSEKPKNPEGKNISYSNCELDNVYVHAKGEMEEVKIFAAGQVKNIRIYAEGQLSNIMMLANGNVDNVEAFTEGDVQSMLTYDDGKEKLEFELIENSIDTLSVEDTFARNIFNHGAPAAGKGLQCQECFSKSSEQFDLATNFNNSSTHSFNAENECVNVGLSAKNTRSRIDESGYDGDICNWDTNTDILTLDFNGDDYLGKNCNYNSDDSTEASLASNGNMNKSVNTQSSFANTIKLLRNRSNVRSFGTSLQDSQPQTLTAVYAVGVWKPEDLKKTEEEPLPGNNPSEETIRGSLGINFSQPRVQRGEVKFRLRSDSILTGNESVTNLVISEKPDFTSVTNSPGQDENVAMVTTAPLVEFEKNQQFALRCASNVNLGSKISVVKENKYRDCIDCNANPKEEQAESLLAYRIDPIDHCHNVVPFLKPRIYTSDKSIQSLLENKFDFFVRNLQSLLDSRLYQLKFGLQTLLEDKIDIINYDLKELINLNYDGMYQIDKVSKDPEYLMGDRGDLLVVALEEVDKHSFNPSSDKVVEEANRSAADDIVLQGPIFADIYNGHALHSLDKHVLAQSETTPTNRRNDLNAKNAIHISSKPKERISIKDSSLKLRNESIRPDNKQNKATQINPLQKSTSNKNNAWLVQNWPSGASRLSGLLLKCTSKEKPTCDNSDNEIWDHNNQRLNDTNEFNPPENSETTTESYYGDQMYQNLSDESSTSLKVTKTKKDLPTNIEVDIGHQRLQNEINQSARVEALINNLVASEDQVLIMSQDYKRHSVYRYPRLAEAIDNNENTKIQNTFHIDKERKLNSTCDPNHWSQNHESSLGYSQNITHTNFNKNMRLNSDSLEGVIEQFTSNENYTVDYAKRKTGSKPVIYLGVKANYHVHPRYPRCRFHAIEKSNNSKGDDDPAVSNQPSSSAGPSLQRIPLQDRMCDCLYNCAINKSAFQSGAQNLAPNFEEYSGPTQQMVSSSFNNYPMQCCPANAVPNEQKRFQNTPSETRGNDLAPRMSLNQLQPRTFIMEGRLFISSSLGNIRPDIFKPVCSPQLAIAQAPNAIEDNDCGANYVPNVGSYQDNSRQLTEPDQYYESLETTQKPRQASSPYIDSKQYNRRKSSKSDKKLFFQACLINKRCQMNIKESGLMNTKKSQPFNDPFDTDFRTSVDNVGSENARQYNIVDSEVVNYGSRDFQSSPIATCTYQDFCGDVATDFCDCLVNTQETKQCNDACTDVDDLVCPSGSGNNEASISRSNSTVEASSGTKGSERQEYSAKTSSSSASKSQKRPKRKESSSRSISFKVQVGFSASEDDLGNVDTGRCIKEDSLAYGGRGPSGSKSRASMVDSDDDNSKKKYHRPASSSDDVCTDDVTTPSDFSDEEDRCTRNKTCRSFACKCSESKKPWRPSPNSKNAASRRYDKKKKFEKHDSDDVHKDAACECSCSGMSPDCVNFKRSNRQSPSHSEKHKFKRIEMNISSKRADSDSNLDSEPLELHCKRCSSLDVDKSRYVDEIGFVRERPGPNRGYKELIDSPTKKRAQNSYDYDYETDDEDYSKREEKGSQKYYRHYKASTSKTSPGRHGQNIPPWSEKSANAFSNNPQRKTQQSISHSTFNRYSSAESKAFSLPVKCSNVTECGTSHRWARTPATNPRASISTDEELSDVAGVAGRCSHDCKSQSAAIYTLNHLPRWSPQKESCPPRSNTEVENLDIYEKIGVYDRERWDNDSQSALYDGEESKVKRRLPRGFFMHEVDDSEE